MKRSAVLLMTMIACGALTGADEKKPPSAAAPVLWEDTYSFTVPAGWSTEEFQGLRYKVSRDKPRNNYSSNIFIIDEDFRGTLDDYAKKNLKMLGTGMKVFQIIERSEFVTRYGIKGIKLRFVSEQAGRLLRQTQYYFEKGNDKYIVTCSALADGGQALDKVFDKSMETFQFHRRY